MPKLPEPRNGLSAIIRERVEHKAKHGYDNSHDDAHTMCELRDAAIFLLTGDYDYFPSNWSEEILAKFEHKDDVGQLVVAGSLIAAEIDRILRKRKSEVVG